MDFKVGDIVRFKNHPKTKPKFFGVEVRIIEAKPSTKGIIRLDFEGADRSKCHSSHDEHEWKDYIELVESTLKARENIQSVSEDKMRELRTNIWNILTEG